MRFQNAQVIHILKLSVLSNCVIFYDKLTLLGKFKRKLSIENEVNIRMESQKAEYLVNNVTYKTIDVKIRVLLKNIEEGIERKLRLFANVCL